MRCTCAEPDCPICSATSAQPWTPKPGESPDPLVIHNRQLLAANAHLVAQLSWNRRQAIRRAVLIFLLTGLGSMLGSAATILCFLNLN